MPHILSSKGQITIPKKIRDFLKVEPGSQIEFEIGADGRVAIIKIGDGVKPAPAPRYAKGEMTTDQIMALLRGEA